MRIVAARVETPERYLTTTRCYSLPQTSASGSLWTYASDDLALGPLQLLDGEARYAIQLIPSTWQDGDPLFFELTANATTIDW